MALFLQESTVQAEAQVSLHEAMEALYEFSNEQAMMNEALLRADFVIHEQVRVLREAGNEDAAGKKEKGFMGKAWELLKELIAKAKAMVVKVYNYIKQKAQQFWAWVKEKYAAAKTFVISKSKKAWAYACAKASAARLKLATALVSGGMKVAGVDHPEFAKIEAELAAAKKVADAADEIGAGELEGVVEELTKNAAALQGITEKAEAAAAKGGDNAVAQNLRAVAEQAKKGAADAMSGLAAAVGAKPKKA